MSYIIRPIQENEFEEILTVQSDAYRQDLHEDLDSLKSKQFAFPNGCVGAFENHRLVGYAISFPWFHDVPVILNTAPLITDREFDCYYMHDIAVLSQHRGHGIADKFVNNCFSNARLLHLYDIRMVTVQGGQHIWSRYGFEIIGDAHESYGPNAYKMGLLLDN
jgi:predicted N-acetyltransferase YhbS